MGALVYMDPLEKKLCNPEHWLYCYFLMQSARAKGSLSPSIVKLLAPTTPSPHTHTPPPNNKPSMDWLNAFNLMGSSHSRLPNMSLSTFTIESREAIAERAADDSPRVCCRIWHFASFSTPVSFLFSSSIRKHMLHRSALCESVFQNWSWVCPFHLQLQKLYYRGIFGGVGPISAESGHQ